MGTKSREDRLLAWTAGVAALAGIPVAVIAGRPLSILAIIGCAILSIPYLISRGLGRSDNEHLMKRGSLLKIVGNAALPGLLLTFLVIPATRDFVVHDAIGFKRRETVVDGQVLVASYTDHHRLRVTAVNPAAVDRIASKVTVTVEVALPSPPCSGDVLYRYRVEDFFAIVDRSRKFEVEGRAIEEDQRPGDPDSRPEEFSTGVSGEATHSCGTQELRFSFPVNMVLKGREATVFEIKVPAQVAVKFVGRFGEVVHIVRCNGAQVRIGKVREEVTCGTGNDDQIAGAATERCGSRATAWPRGTARLSDAACSVAVRDSRRRLAPARRAISTSCQDCRSAATARS